MTSITVTLKPGIVPGTMRIYLDGKPAIKGVDFDVTCKGHVVKHHPDGSISMEPAAPRIRRAQWLRERNGRGRA